MPVQDHESQEPYDILITDSSGQQTYVEVKSTRAQSRDAFPISREEMTFAAKAGNAYHIFRLTGAGKLLSNGELFTNVQL